MSASDAVELFTFKVLVVGGFGIGKTTLIQQVSEVPVVGTEVATTGDEASIKETTTVGIEYGSFSVVDGDSAVTLLLFGTPGQDRFSDVRTAAGRGVDGLIVLVDGGEPGTWRDGLDLYDAFNPDGTIPTALVVNRWPTTAAPPDGLAEAIPLRGPAVVSSGDVVSSNDVRRFLVELLLLMLETDEARPGAESKEEVPANEHA